VYFDNLTDQPMIVYNIGYVLGGPDLTFHPNNMGIPYKLAIVLKQRLKFKILQGTQSWAQHIAYIPTVTEKTGPGLFCDKIGTS